MSPIDLPFLHTVIPSDPEALRDEASRRLSRQEVRVSGVGQRGHWNKQLRPFSLPLDKDSVQLGQTSKRDCRERGLERFYPPPMLCQPYDNLHLPLAYFIHERCWHLARRQIGARVLEDNLDLFLITVHETINEDVDDVVDAKNETWGDSEGYLCKEALMKYSVDEFMKDPQGCMQEWIDKLIRKRRPCSVLRHRDPLNIPELQALITEATSRQQETIQASGLYDIPPELRCLVAGSPENPHDIVNMVIAFHWQLPNNYWRTRFGTDFGGVVFDFEHCDYQDVDWKYLYFGVLGLFEKSHGLRNRRRILKELELIKRVFWDLMKEREQENIT